MRFELLPLLDLVSDLYERPRSIARFNKYLELLQGSTKGDLHLPISGFNPMAKDHILQKVAELKALNAEYIVQEVLAQLNSRIRNQINNATYKVGLNLADDFLGGWTNRYTTDYDSKFRISAFVKRCFCVVYFWTSETFTHDVIETRTLEYVYRTIYRQTNPPPKTLEEHVAQERYVAKQIFSKRDLGGLDDLDFLKTFYKEHKDTESYHLIFNFFYGDEASKSLAFPLYGIFEKMAGYKYAKCIN